MARWLLLLVSILLVVKAHGEGEEHQRQLFQERLELAIQLNTTAPWRESQAVLDELRADLDQADDYQRAEFHWLEARNLGLAGDLAGSLRATEALMELPLAPEQQVKTYRLAANVALIARKFEEAFTYLSRGLELLTDPALHPHGESLYSLASHAYTLVGDAEQGIHFGQLAVELADQTDQDRSRCSANQRLGFALKTTGKPEKSLHHYRQALDYCLEAGDHLIAGIVRSGMGDLLREIGKSNEAGTQFVQALPALEEHGYHAGLAEARLYYARLKMDRDQPDEAEALLNLALEPLAESEIWDYLAEAHGLLSQIARARGDYEAAFHHHEEQLLSNKRAHDLERSRRISFLEVQFNLLHNQQQLALLEEQNRVNRLEEATRLQQRQIRNFAYGLAGLLMVVLALLLFHALRERRRYQTLSETDGLTGALNHTFFFAVAEQELERAKMSGQHFWLLLADIDHFKQVNDQHGHLAGDDILRKVGRCLRQCFGEHGTIGRIGGEEFAVTFRDQDRDQVEAPLQAFREALTKQEKDLPTVTMSFGLARQAVPEEPLHAIRERADQALYQAKREGRNRVICKEI